jgi:hypothetical protein
MNTLVIDRQLWQRGRNEDSMLRSERDGQQCCLGFEAKSCGFSDADIVGEALPSSIPSELYKRPGIDQDRWAKLVDVNGLSLSRGHVGTVDTDFGMEAASINDDSKITEEEREVLLVALFAMNDVALTFIN